MAAMNDIAFHLASYPSTLSFVRGDGGFCGALGTSLESGLCHSEEEWKVKCLTVLEVQFVEFDFDVVQVKG